MTHEQPAITIRPATHDDLTAIAAFDQFKVVDAAAISLAPGSGGITFGGGVHVAVVGDAVAGYILVNRSFFRQPFVSFLVVHPDHRRAGVCSALLEWAEKWCDAPKLWLSTSQENLTMQRVLISRGYRNAGLVEGLFRVPELFYCKAMV